MTIPTIAATGSMASGVYTAYMEDYLSACLDTLETQIKSYTVDKTITDWYNQWDTILDDVGTNVTTLNTNIDTIQAQIMMIKDALTRL